MGIRRKLTRREFLAGTGLAVAGTLLPMGQESPAKSASRLDTLMVQAPRTPVTIRMAYWAVEAHMVGMNEVVEAFHAARPNIRLEVIVPPVGDYFTKLLSMYAGGQGPDILYTPGYWFPTALSKRLVRDVDQYVRRDGWNTGVYYPKVLDAFKRDGKIYGIPWVWATNHIFWNKTLFDQAGVEYPATSLDDKSWTWDKFVDVAKRLTRRDPSGAPVSFGFNLPIRHWSWPFIFTRANGGGVLSGDLKTCLLKSPQSLEALRWVVDLQRKHHVLPTVAGGAGATVPNFQTGRIGMDLTAAPVISAWWRLPFEWDVAHNPIGPKGRSATLSPEAFVISTATQHPDEAWEVLKFLGSSVAQEIQAKNLRAMPAIVSVAEGRTFLPADKSPRHRRVLWETLQYAREPEYPVFWPELTRAMANEMEPAFYEGKTVLSIALAICKQVDTLIAESR